MTETFDPDVTLDDNFHNILHHDQADDVDEHDNDTDYTSDSDSDSDEYDSDISNRNSYINMTDDLAVYSYSGVFDPLKHLESLGPGTPVDPELLSLTPQIPILSDAGSVISFSSMSDLCLDQQQFRFVDLSCGDSSLVINREIDCSNLPNISEVHQNSFIPYDTNPPLILDPRALPHLLPIDRMEMLTPTPINIGGVSIIDDIEDHIPISTVMLETIADSYTDDIEDDVFETNSVIELDSADNSSPEPIESNWKLGDEEGNIFPAKSL